mmetsp:Transcript_22574/g.37176  ORF Transcript_22574/g.37176 Transcript_22574/m.37176 type:complete len:237 (+) Transcript_22574:835-1545(+)
MSLLETTGAKMLVSTSSQWEQPERRLRDVTVLSTFTRTENGRSTTTTPVSCPRELSQLSQSLRRRSAVSSAFGTTLLLPRIPRRLPPDTARRVFSSPLFRMFRVTTTSERLTTSQTSSSWSPREKSSTETSSLEPTGHRMLVSTNSLWELPDKRLRDVTLTFMSSRMANGRSLNTIPVSCPRQASLSRSPRRRSRIFSNFGTRLLPLRTPMPLPSVTLPRLSFSPLCLMCPVPTTV